MCTTRKRMSLNLYNTSTGNIPLNNFGLAGNRGLVISAFGLRHKDRRTVTQTSGMYAILNKCELLKCHPTFRGMLFGDSQIRPQLIDGAADTKDVRYERACIRKREAASDPVKSPVLPEGESSASEDDLPEEEFSAGEDDLPATGHNPTPWQLSGFFRLSI
jgi:hypothetical protein